MVNRRCVCTPLSPVFIRKELVMTFTKHTSLIAAAVIASVLSNAQASSPKPPTEAKKLERLARLGRIIEESKKEQTVSSRAKRLGKAVLKHKGKIALATTGAVATGIAVYLAYQAAQNGTDLSLLKNYTQSVSETVQAGLTSGSNVLQSGANQMSSGLHGAYNYITSISLNPFSKAPTPAPTTSVFDGASSVFDSLRMCSTSDVPVPTPTPTPVPTPTASVYDSLKMCVASAAPATTPASTIAKTYSTGRNYSTLLGPLMQMPFDAYNYGVKDAFFLGFGDYLHMAGVQPN